MAEGLIVVIIVGFITGYVFSIPAAGPVMILVTSNGLKGRLRFCHRVTYGAALADFVYAFVGVYAFARLYSLYEPYIPYILGIGSFFLIGLGLKILRTDIDFEQSSEGEILKDKLKNKGGFRIGMLVNFLNPALFVGWLASSFIMISLASALGFNTAGLNVQLESNISHIENATISKEIEGRTKAIAQVTHTLKHDKTDFSAQKTPLLTLFTSFIFAAMLAVGSTVWFYYLSNFVVTHRKKLKLDVIKQITRVLAVVLIGLGTYLVIDSCLTLF